MWCKCTYKFINYGSSMDHGVHACFGVLGIGSTPTPLLANTGKDSASLTERRKARRDKGEVFMSVFAAVFRSGNLSYGSGSLDPQS
jgi:hypothetical protein